MEAANEQVALKVVEWMTQAQEVAPELATEIVRWGLFDCSFGLGFGVLLLTVLAIAVRVLILEQKKEHSDENTQIIAGVVMAIMVMFGPLITVIALATIGKILLAPKFYVLGKLANLL